MRHANAGAATLRPYTPYATMVPDVYFDQVGPTLSLAAIKVLNYIIRRTKGFGKDQDAISLKQFVHGIETRDGVRMDVGTGLSRASVLAGRRQLEDLGLIIVLRSRTSLGDADTNIYRLRLPDHPNHLVGKLDHPGQKVDHPPRQIGSKVVKQVDHGSLVTEPGVAGQLDPQESDSQESVKQEESPPDISQTLARDAEPPEPDTPRRDAEPRPSEDLLPTIRHLARRVANGARRAAWHRQLAADLADYVAKSPLSAAQLERLVRLVEAHGPLRTEAEFWERLDLYRATYVQPQAPPASAIVPAEPSAHRVGSPLETAKGRQT